MPSFTYGTGIGRIEQRLIVRFVFGEQQRHHAIAVKIIIADVFSSKRVVNMSIHNTVAGAFNLGHNGLGTPDCPRPGVAKPQASAGHESEPLQGLDWQC